MAFGPVEAYLERAIGLDIESVGRRKLSAVIAARMREQGVADAAAYCALIARNPAEREHVIEDIVVPETWFFRDRGPFELLEKLCAAGVLAAAQTQPLRILSLPCATGEEPYSIAMALVAAGMHPGWLAIDAVDISSRCLEKARQALYGRPSFRGRCEPWQERFFSPDGKSLRLDPAVARLVNFHQANILAPSLPAGLARQYQVIFCRNLFIYLTQQARKHVFDRLDAMLAPGGLLFAGHTEVLLFQQFGYDLMPERGCFACKKPGAKLPVAPPPRQPERRPAEKKSAQPRRAAAPRQRIFKTGQQKGADPQEALADVRSLADRGELERAAALCSSYLQSGPGSLDSRAHCLMGEICQARNDAPAAERHFLRAVYLDPACYDGLVHLSLLYDYIGSSEKALRYKKRAARLHRQTA